MAEAWPFLKPVNKKQVKDYYNIIKKPIDMETMGKKIQGMFVVLLWRYKYSITFDRTIKLEFYPFIYNITSLVIYFEFLPAFIVF